MLNAETLEVQAPHKWRWASLLLVAVLLSLFALYWKTFTGLVGMWNGSENYAHAFVVPPISLWLIWRRRHELLACTPRPAPIFLLPLCVAAAVWLFGELATANALTHFAVVLALVSLVPALLGTELAKVIAFPLGFLFFGVPFGEFLFPVMMNATADFTVAALRLSGVPVYREGLQFVIPSGNWSVIEACSGLRYLIASVMVGTLFGYLNYQSLRKRLAFVCVAILVPLLANWVRAYMIVMIGHLSGNELATGVDHLIYGWAFFGVVMLLMFVIGSRFADDEPQPASLPQVAQMPAERRRSTDLAMLLSAGLIALLLAAPHLAFRALERWEPSAEPVLHPISTDGPSWAAIDLPAQGWQPDFLPPSASLHQRFAQAGSEVGLYVAYYRHQTAERKLVSDQNQLVRTSSRQWSQVTSGRATAELGQRTLALNTAELRGTDSPGLSAPRLVVWQLYWVNGRWVQSPAQAKAFGALYRLLGRGDDGASVLVYTNKTSADNAAQALTAFLRANLPAIEAELSRARGDAR